MLNQIRITRCVVRSKCPYTIYEGQNRKNRFQFCWHIAFCCVYKRFCLSLSIIQKVAHQEMHQIRHCFLKIFFNNPWSRRIFFYGGRQNTYQQTSILTDVATLQYRYPVEILVNPLGDVQRRKRRGAHHRVLLYHLL